MTCFNPTEQVSCPYLCSSFMILITFISSQELILAPWNQSHCGTRATPPTEGRQSTTERCPVPTLPFRPRASPNFWSELLLEISTVNPSAARIWRSDPYSGANCSKQWFAASDAGSADLVLHARLCWLRLKTFVDNTCWVKCTPGSNKSICNPLATQRLSPNVPNIIFTVSERDRGKNEFTFFHAAKYLCLHFVWARK